VLLEAVHVVDGQSSALNFGCLVDVFVWVRFSFGPLRREKRSVNVRALGRKTLREYLRLK